jgi:hypothetical protein
VAGQTAPLEPYWICGVDGNMSFVALLLLLYAIQGAAAEASLSLVYACSSPDSF